MQEQIEREISKNLTGEMRETALKFTAFLKSHGLMFHRDRSGDWAEKIYYWARSDKNCVCFIAVKGSPTSLKMRGQCGQTTARRMKRR